MWTLVSHRRVLFLDQEKRVKSFGTMQTDTVSQRVAGKQYHIAQPATM